jgi:hypothetical protein
MAISFDPQDRGVDPTGRTWCVAPNGQAAKLGAVKSRRRIVNLYPTPGGAVEVDIRTDRLIDEWTRPTCGSGIRTSQPAITGWASIGDACWPVGHTWRNSSESLIVFETPGA